METRNAVQASTLLRGASATVLHRLKRSSPLHSFPPSITKSRRGGNKKRKGKKEPESPSNYKPIAASQDYRFRKNRRCRSLSMVFSFLYLQHNSPQPTFLLLAINSTSLSEGAIRTPAAASREEPTNRRPFRNR